MSPHYTAVVFDFGGVLITPITNLLNEVAGWHEVEMLTMLDVLMGTRETSTDHHPWHRAERGEIPTAMLQAEVVPYATAAGLTLRGDEYERVLSGEFLINEEVVERVGSLQRDGYATALLTNSFKEFRSFLESKVDFGLFDVVVDSSEVGHRKPEPAIYELVAERLGVSGEQIVYLDDFHANLVGAEAAGWTTIHVTDVHQALIDLDDLLQ